MEAGMTPSWYNSDLDASGGLKPSIFRTQRLPPQSQVALLPHQTQPQGEATISRADWARDSKFLKIMKPFETLIGWATRP